jgi:hypothetical protein
MIGEDIAREFVARAAAAKAKAAASKAAATAAAAKAKATAVRSDLTQSQIDLVNLCDDVPVAKPPARLRLTSKAAAGRLLTAKSTAVKAGNKQKAMPPPRAAAKPPPKAHPLSARAQIVYGGGYGNTDSDHAPTVAGDSDDNGQWYTDVKHEEHDDGTDTGTDVKQENDDDGNTDVKQESCYIDVTGSDDDGYIDVKQENDDGTDVTGNDNDGTNDVKLENDDDGTNDVEQENNYDGTDDVKQENDYSDAPWHTDDVKIENDDDGYEDVKIENDDDAPWHTEDVKQENYDDLGDVTADDDNDNDYGIFDCGIFETDNHYSENNPHSRPRNYDAELPLATLMSMDQADISAHMQDLGYGKI